MQTKRAAWLLLTIAFAIALITFSFSHILTDPAHAIPELGGDAAKNTFTYLYHSMYGKGYWFTGMNYPYGEHIVYTDGQPLLSVTLAALGNVSAPTALATMWLLIGLSYVLCIVYIYRILVHYGAHPLPAMLFAGLITIFSPQILRLQGHFALAYACLIPMVFYWSILYYEQKKLKYCLYIFIAGAIMAFFHLYFAAMLLFWAASYTAGYMLLIKGERFGNKVRHVMPMLLTCIFVFVLLSLSIRATDPIHDRPETPFITLETNTHIKQIVSSAYSPIWQYALKQHFVPALADNQDEGYLYLGAVMGFVLVISLISFAARKAKKQQPAKDAFPTIWIFMAVVVLLLGMGIPFKWHMQWLMGIIPALKQFRSMGRFSWVFYYIMAIYTALAICRFATRLMAQKKIALAYGIYALTLGLWAFDASGYVMYTRRLGAMARYNYDVTFSKKDVQSWEAFLKEHDHKASDFQAILLLPYFHVGTEKLWVGDVNWLISLGIRPALQLHLPIIDVMSSRSSWGQAMKQVKIAAGPYADKPLLRDIHSTKPFLLLRYEGSYLDDDQRYLLSASDYIGHLVDCNIYVCYPDRILANDKKMVAQATAIAANMHANDTCIDCAGGYYYDHHDNGKATRVFFGHGAAPFVADTDFTVATIPVHPIGDSQRYELSAWFLLTTKDYRSPIILMRFLDSTGKITSSKYVLTKQSVDNYDMWFRTSAYFYIPRKCRTLSCKMPNDLPPSYIAMDELLLRPATATVISRVMQVGTGTPAIQYMINNHPQPGAHNKQ
jgi:hypothetical protein